MSTTCLTAADIEAPQYVRYQRNSISDLREIEILPASFLPTTARFASVGGYYEEGDGGGQPFTWDADSTEPDNNGTVIKPNNISSGNPGRWKAVCPNTLGISVKAFGARGINSGDDTAAFQAAINAAGAGDGMTSVGGIAVLVPPGVYRLTNVGLLRGVKIVGVGPKVSIIRKTSTTGYAFEFDSTGITPGTVQDQVTIEGVSIWQVGTPTNGGGIRVDGVTSDARATLLDVHVQNCYRGVLTRNTIQNMLRNVNCFYSVKKGFEFTGSSYAMTAINCFASSGGDDGWELNDGNYCTLVGCAADNNAEAGYRFKNCHFMKVVGCGNEGNKYGAYLYICDGVEIDTFYTLVKSNTLNAIVLDASQRNTLRNIGSSHVNSSYGTYMVSAINGSVFNVLETGYQSHKWPGASNDGVVDDIGAFMEVTHFLEGAQPAVKNIRWPVVNLTTGMTNLRGVTFNGGIIPPIDMKTALANEARIMALYSSGNTFSGFGMSATDLAPRIAGNPGGSGYVAELGYYSEDGNWTWASRFRFTGQGVLVLRNGCQFLDGDGSPEGVVSAPPGSLFLNKQGGASTELYTKETGSGNTGWKAVTTV